MCACLDMPEILNLGFRCVLAACLAVEPGLVNQLPP